jgi:hypothetical protein
MARTEAQRARARAQRATAARVRNRTTILPKAVTRQSRQAQIDQGYRWLNGTDPMPRPESAEARQAARLAALARWQKAPYEFQAAFQQYWYHDEDGAAEAAIVNEEYYDEDEEDEE